jgi:hypothetical protein
VNLWRELACTYDKTLAWWPHQKPSFQRLLTLRDRARQLGTKNALKSQARAGMEMVRLMQTSQHSQLENCSVDAAT